MAISKFDSGADFQAKISLTSSDVAGIADVDDEAKLAIFRCVCVFQLKPSFI